MTTKFSPGDRVSIYKATGVCRGTVLSITEDGNIKVQINKYGTCDTFHPKQLRRLRKKTRVVWESDGVIISAINTHGGRVQVDDAISFSEAIAEFIGKRVRIVITEAKPQEKGER